MRVAYLGPAGTFSEEALRHSGFLEELPEPIELSPVDTLPGVIGAVADGTAGRGLVPVENSIEGSVRPTLDGLIRHTDRVRIAGEYDHQIRSALISRHEIPLDRIEAVLSHPQPLAQCALFLASQLPQAELRVAPSTSAAVREVTESDRPWAALAPASATGIYGGRVLRQEIEDEPGNVTRFLWLKPRTNSGFKTAPDASPAGSASAQQAGHEPHAAGQTGSDSIRHGSGSPEPRSGWKTSLVFAELGADHPGSLVEALEEFSSRGVNLVRIESRPLRRELGRYRFFIDLEGAETDPAVAAAIAGLRNKAEWVRSLGSYPTR